MDPEERELLRRFYERPFTEWPGWASKYADPEIEFVTREGRMSGQEDFVAWVEGFVEATERRFSADFELQELVEAGDGTVIALLEVRRRSRDSEGDYLTAWPATVWRLRHGRVVFFEGYQDRGKALRDYGIER